MKYRWKGRSRSDMEMQGPWDRRRPLFDTAEQTTTMLDFHSHIAMGGVGPCLFPTPPKRLAGITPLFDY